MLEPCTPSTPARQAHPTNTTNLSRRLLPGIPRCDVKKEFRYAFFVPVIRNITEPHYHAWKLKTQEEAEAASSPPQLRPLTAASPSTDQSLQPHGLSIPATRSTGLSPPGLRNEQLPPTPPQTREFRQVLLRSALSSPHIQLL